MINILLNLNLNLNLILNLNLNLRSPSSKKGAYNVKTGNSIVDLTGHLISRTVLLCDHQFRLARHVVG
ncbi:MAG: hypothetical protein EA364_08285, partial [Balneolaceae bacterium]